MLESSLANGKLKLILKRIIYYIHTYLEMDTFYVVIFIVALQSTRILFYAEWPMLKV